MTTITARSPFRLAILFFCLCTNPLHAVEVSLEENKAERGNIGYVDLQAVFRLFPGTQKAKQNFEEVVRQAEEQVNVRKLEVYRLEAELTQLRTQREFMQKNPNPGKAPQLPGMEMPKSESDSRNSPGPLEVTPPTVSGSSTSAAQAPISFHAPADTSISTAAVATSTAAATPSAVQNGIASSTATAPSVAASTAAAPSVATSTVTTLSVAASTTPVPSVSASTQTAQPPITNLPGIMAEAAKLPSPGSPAEIDARIADRTKLLEQKKAELRTYEDQVEKNLLDLESRRTEIILGKIYAAVQAVAQAEGISVVVDKSQILFGHKAVDLTGKVLERLKSIPQ